MPVPVDAAGIDWIDAIGKLGLPTVLLLVMCWFGWRGIMPLLTRLAEGHLLFLKTQEESLSKLTEVVQALSHKVEDNGKAIARVEEEVRK